MLNLFRAEWRKIGGNRPVIFFLIWIFPIGSAILLFLAVGLLALLPAELRAQSGIGVLRWDEQVLSAWSAPGGGLARLLLIGFSAFVFAGEYQWGTWKNLIPRNRRVALALVKFTTIAAYTLAAFTLMSVVLGIGGGVVASIFRASYDPPLSGEVLTSFAGQYAFHAALGLVTTLIGAGFTAIAAIFTRSILAGVVAAFGVSLVEGLAPAILFLAGGLLRAPQLVALSQFLPNYSIENIRSWVVNGTGATLPVVAQYAPPHSLALSLVLTTFWLSGLIGAAVLIFQRQDITT